MYLFRLACILVFISPTIFAEGLGIRLSDESAQFEYFTRSDISIGAGGSDISYALFYNETNDVVLTGKILAAGNIQGSSRAFNVAIGGKAYAGRLDDVNDDLVAALALGGKVSYVVPSTTPMAAYLEAFVAPDITTFGDSEGLLDWEIGFEVEVAPSASVFVGLRKLEIEIGALSTDYEVDDTAHVGLQLSF